jgi:hypothetical protein
VRGSNAEMVPGAIAAQARAQATDAWTIQLERVRGKVGGDGIERIATQALFDILEVPQRLRTPGACRRLAKVMTGLNWSPVKARGLDQAGFKDQIRGYARDRRGTTVF